ncbi:MAG: hypothetical protein NVS9B12_13190 [Vulcanimicrobiaceae bacterium]
MTDNLGELGDALYSKNEEIAQINERLSEKEAEKRLIEERLLAAMQAAGTDIARGSRATVSLSEVTRAHIVDFDKFTQFVLRKKALHLFERRVSAKAYKEMKDTLGGKDVPGLIDFVQTRINVRKVS